MKSGFKEITAPTISELFQQQIEEMIFSGQLSYGEKLPTERELADQMKISKSVVHLSLKQLEANGFVKTVPRQGTFVTNYFESGNPNTLLALLRYHGGRLDAHTTRSMIEMRAAVENMAFRLCCKNADPAAVQQLDRDSQELKNAIDAGMDSSELPSLIYKYHLDLCIQSGNNILPLVLNSFKEVSLELWHDWYQFQGPEKTLETLQQYTASIRENRPDEAIALYDEKAELFFDWYKKCRLSLE